MFLYLLIYLVVFVRLFFIFAAVWGAEFKFLSELPKYKVINTGEETDFNCTTNDATAVSSLWMKLDGGAWKERKLEARKIVKKGNVFTLLNADTNDARQHKCKAENQAGDVIWTRQKNPTYLFVHRGKLQSFFSLLKASGGTLKTC